jgi:hypothetical protein
MGRCLGSWLNVLSLRSWILRESDLGKNDSGQSRQQKHWAKDGCLEHEAKFLRK